MFERAGKKNNNNNNSNWQLWQQNNNPIERMAVWNVGEFVATSLSRYNKHWCGAEYWHNHL